MDRPGRDEEIDKVIQSIRAAGKVGLPVIEYNFYAHRLTEGYYEETGRAGAGMTAFDYDKVKDLPPLEREGAHSLDEMWANITYFLKAVVPVAEQSGVRLALHPNDPPAPISRGSGQIMSTLAGWKRLIDIVKSPSNGLTFDCGVTRELGEDPVEVCRYLGARDCINHVHYRNVKVRKPYEKYTEVFLDEGDNNMFLVMKELVRQKYPRLIYPEHPRASTTTANGRTSARRTRAAGDMRRTRSTWVTRGPCCRPPCRHREPAGLPCLRSASGLLRRQSGSPSVHGCRVSTRLRPSGFSSRDGRWSGPDSTRPSVRSTARRGPDVLGSRLHSARCRDRVDRGR